MGLAASQARFLGLTARKSNVEYQGQQINQARTALSNEVMDLYQKYNSLDVPVPPSVNDYTKTVYTVDSTYENYRIENFTKITSGDDAGYYNVTLQYDDDVPTPYSFAVKNLIASAEKDGDTYKKLSFTIGSDIYEYDGTSESTIDKSTIKKIDIADVDKYAELKILIDEGKFSPDDKTFYTYTRNNVKYYTSESELDAAFGVNNTEEAPATDNSHSYYGTYTFEYVGSQKVTKEIQAKASLTQEASGRLSAISVVECEEDPSLVNTTHSITTGSEDDEKRYQDAMNQYYYKKQRYEREVEIINKKTEKIQAEDKALELKLNQLDTEQNAISTEMDSISKVIEDTIKSVFKTFNS